MMGDESGESMEPMVDGEKLGVDSRDEGKHSGRNDLLLVGKMMWMDERV